MKLVLGIIVSLFLFITIAPIQANSLGKVGIALSATCLTFNQSNITSLCPTYLDLKPLDSSEERISGEFVTDDKGFYHRGPSALQNSYKWYDFEDDWRVFVDPPGEMYDRIKMIYLRPNFDTFTLPEDNTVNNNTLIVHHNRYMEKCHTAIINADIWKEILADTIYYMRNECQPQFTSLNTTEYIVRDYIEHDITTSSKYKHEAWLKNITENCINEYGKC